MALPTLQKTWQFNVNNAVGGTSEAQDHADALFLIKDALTSFTDQPWTVTLSSDTVSAGAADYWVDAGDLVWADVLDLAPFGSWIVLQNANGQEILIHCLTATGEREIQVFYSNASGFSGGSTVSLPTATDQVQMIDNVSSDPEIWLAGKSAAANYKIHVLHSTDGKATWIVMCYDGYCSAVWGFAGLTSAVSGYTNPSIAFIYKSTDGTSDRPTYAMLWQSQVVRSTDNSDNSFLGALSGEGFADSPVGALTGANHFSSEYAMVPCAFSSNSGAPGRHGIVPDVWYGSDTLATGDTYPNDTSRQFAQFGVIILPWDGSVVSVS